MPPCQNNGICLQPGECACPENFVGSYCEQEKKLCLSPPTLPRNSKRSCNSKTCTITCASGYRFPDGTFQGQKMVSIEATAGIFNRTAGLCGTMDQNGQNDFMSKDGTLHEVSGFNLK